MEFIVVRAERYRNIEATTSWSMLMLRYHTQFELIQTDFLTPAQGDLGHTDLNNDDLEFHSSSTDILTISMDL